MPFGHYNYSKKPTPKKEPSKKNATNEGLVTGGASRAPSQPISATTKSNPSSSGRYRTGEGMPGTARSVTGSVVSPAKYPTGKIQRRGAFDTGEMPAVGQYSTGEVLTGKPGAIANRYSTGDIPAGGDPYRTGELFAAEPSYSSKTDAYGEGVKSLLDLYPEEEMQELPVSSMQKRHPTPTEQKEPKPLRTKKESTPKTSESANLIPGIKPQKIYGACTAAYAPRRTNLLGNLLYTLGFYAEYYLLRFWRTMRDASVFFAQIFVWLFGGFFIGIFNVFKGIVQDIKAPLTNVKAKGDIARHKQRGSAKGQDVSAENPSGGAGGLTAVVLTIFKFMLPIAATAVLLLTIQILFSKNYALAVEVDGNIIGYVADETVLEDAQSILRMKIQLAPNQTLSEWQFTPVLRIGTADVLSNKTEIADQILLNSAEDIVKANGILIDNVLVGVTQEGDQLRQLLDDMLAQYRDADNESAEVDFVRDVEVSEDGGVYFTDSVQSFEELRAFLTRIEEPAMYYTVQKGETLSDIARQGGISMEELLLRNPQFEGKKDTFMPEEGLEVLLRRDQPYLQVQKSFKHQEEEELPFETIEKEDATRPLGFRRIMIQGVKGRQLAWYDYVYIDGELVQKVRRDDGVEVVEAPVAEEIIVGTLRIGDGGIGGYSSTYLWPVPDAIYSSRGFRPGGYHRGLDINGPTGTPVYSSNAGTVTFAGFNYSYGYYVEIEHADGIHTVYAHNSSLYVQTGDVVGQMMMIAAMGSTGNSTGPHCHFEILIDGIPVDPLGFVSAPFELGY